MPASSQPSRCVSRSSRVRGPAHLYGVAIAIILGIGWPDRSCAARIDVFAHDPEHVNIAKIEGASPGDVVTIGPGTYRFRLYLTAVGSTDRPIVIRARDPSARPVWDLGGRPVAEWPGSYRAGDRGRGIWQIAGAHYEISDIVFRGGSDRSIGDSAGVRLKSASHVSLRNCLFQENDNGLQGAGRATLVEFSEFDRNGLPGAREASHNVYMHGGDITVRYSYIHDAIGGQNLHVRANRAIFEYNWIARSRTYLADLMPCTYPPCDPDQYLVLRGNVLVSGTPIGRRQIIGLVNDQAVPGLGLHLTMINNTVIGGNDSAALVRLVNGDPTRNRVQSVRLINNAVVDVRRVLAVDRLLTANWLVSGANNWVNSEANAPRELRDTIRGRNPAFRDQRGLDLVPTPESALVGSALPVPDAPVREYYRDETVTMRWRERAHVRDIGAFESTTLGPSQGHVDIRQR